MANAIERGDGSSPGGAGIAASARLDRRFGQWLVSLVYPPRCVACGERGSWVCATCRPLVPLFGDEVICDGCGLPVALPCRCAEIPLHIGQIRSVGPFAGWLRDEILAFKYEDEWARVDDLAPYFAAILQTFPALPDAMVPVPLHPRRLRERGFNQSAMIAAAAGKLLGVPLIEPLARTRQTAQQARLGATERAENVAGAFSCQPGFRLDGQTIVLVDDVLTTGATLGASAAALVPANPAAIWAVTIARQI